MWTQVGPLGTGDIGGVDEVAARVQKRVVNFAALLFRRTPAPVLAEGHRSQAQFRYPKSAFSQQLIAHDVLPLRLVQNHVRTNFLHRFPSEFLFRIGLDFQGLTSVTHALGRLVCCS
jgi:hypothetical protein